MELRAPAPETDSVPMSRQASIVSVFILLQIFQNMYALYTLEK